jgi:hypothetical protein
MLRPKQTKFKKYRKIRIKRIEQRQTSLEFGSFGLRTLEGGQISSRQIEAVRRVITRKLKRTGKLWIRIFPNIPVTKKPVEVRHGVLERPYAPPECTPQGWRPLQHWGHEQQACKQKVAVQGSYRAADHQPGVARVSVAVWFPADKGMLDCEHVR